MLGQSVVAADAGVKPPGGWPRLRPGQRRRGHAGFALMEPMTRCLSVPFPFNGLAVGGSRTVYDVRHSAMWPILVDRTYHVWFLH
jgi:hypothetical protein